MWIVTDDYDNVVDSTDCTVTALERSDDEALVRHRFNFNRLHSWLANATSEYDPVSKHTLYVDSCAAVPCFTLLQGTNGLIEYTTGGYTWALNASSGGLPRWVELRTATNTTMQRVVFQAFDADPAKYFEGPPPLQQPHAACVTLTDSELCYNGTVQNETRIFTRTHDWSIYGWLFENVNVADVRGEATWTSCYFSEYFTQFQAVVGNNWGVYGYCNGGQCGAASWNDYTQLGHKEALGNSRKVDQCYLNHTVGEWWSVPKNGRCPPQYNIGDIRSCSYAYDFQILKTVNASCLDALKSNMKCADDDDAAAVIDAGFAQCPDVGHLLLGDELKKLGTHAERVAAIEPLQFDADDADARRRTRRVWYKTPLSGYYYAPHPSQIVEVNRYFKSIVHDMKDE